MCEIFRIFFIKPRVCLKLPLHVFHCVTSCFRLLFTTVSYFLVYIMLLYHDTFLFILFTCNMILSYSYHNPAPWSWLLTVAGNSDPTRSLDRLWEWLQDHVPHLHGEHLVGVQGTLQPGTSLQRVKGHALLHGLQHPTVQLWVRTELQGCGWPSRFGLNYSINKLLYFYIDIYLRRKKPVNLKAITFIGN